MKIKLRGSTNLLKVTLALGMVISLWNCEKEDHQITTVNPHASNEEFHSPFIKINYSELANDSDFSETLNLLEQHSNNLILPKQALRGKSNSDKKIKLSIVQNEIIKIQKNNVTTWTFELDKRFLKNSDYENFLVKKYNNKFSYHLIAYFETKNKPKEEKGKSFSFEIPKEKLDLSNINLQARGDVFDWSPPDDGGGGFDSSEPCEGIWIAEYEPCSSGGNADGHAPAPQYNGDLCSGSPLVGYIIDFSHCNSGAYDPPSGPSNGSNDPADPGPSPGGGGGGYSDISNPPSDSGDQDGEVLVTSPIPPDDDGNCREGFVKNPVTGECDPICKGGKIYDPITKNCNCPDGKKEDSNGNCVDDCDTTKKDLKQIFPDATDSNLEKIANHINTYGREFGIDNNDKLHHFLAQAGHESKRMIAFEENLNYRWKKLGKSDYWKKYFNLYTDGDNDPNKEDPNDYKRSSTSIYVDVEKFANYVYDDANRDEGYKLGNTSTGDGYKYRGRGIIQLTGKSNYEEFNTFYQEEYDSTKDLVNSPDLLKTDMKIAVISALWFFKNNVLDKLSVNGTTSVTAVTEKVNGGKKGLNDRKELYNKAKINIDCK